jgi:hypothetical protein
MLLPGISLFGENRLLYWGSLGGATLHDRPDDAADPVSLQLSLMLKQKALALAVVKDICKIHVYS